ncbi:hypothetical protein OHB93_01600 [Microbacterium sp. No. 7]|uniref:hypothetical protein n=1 Tax=Microbacterium sp. No. 7 TaxID=1714373 RepID=UPI0030080DE2
MIARRSAALLATVALVTALAACAPAAAPKPSPTPTGFASKEEAFAAAEKTYRAYVDALNEVDLSDPATFEPVYAHLRGEALASEKKTLTQMHADGWTVSGKTTLPRIFDGKAPGDLIVCQDVSAVEVTDASGNSQVAPDRPDVFALDVKIEFDPSSVTAAKVTNSQAVEDRRC